MNQDGNSSASQEPVFSSADNSTPTTNLAGAITSAPEPATNAPAKRARFGFGGRRFNADASAATPAPVANPNMPSYFNAAMNDVVIANPDTAKPKKSKKPLIIGGLLLVAIAAAIVAVIVFLPKPSPNTVSSASIAEKINSDTIAKIHDMEKRLTDYYYERSSLLSVSSDTTKKAIAEGIESLETVNNTLKNGDHVSFNDSVVDLSSLREDVSKSLAFFRNSADRYNSYYTYVAEGKKDGLFELFSSNIKNNAIYHKKYIDYRSGKLAEGEQLDENTKNQINIILADNSLGKGIFFDGDDEIDNYAISEKISNEVMSFWEVSE